MWTNVSSSILLAYSGTMQTWLVRAALTMTLLVCGVAMNRHQVNANPVPAGMMRVAASQSDAFIENKGQWDSRALFMASSPGVDVWVTETGVAYDFNRTEIVPLQGPGRPDETPRHRRRQGHVVRMEFLGGRPSQVTGEGELAGKYNYFIGSKPEGWATGARRFSEAVSEQVYEGVQARWYFDRGAPRYDLVVSPGADPRQIALRFEGALGLSTDGRVLTLGTSMGEVRQAELRAYQEANGRQQVVPCSMEVHGNVLRFNLGSYDTATELVIDPLVWCTYLGGNAGDPIDFVSVGSDGGVYASGQAESSDFPTSIGAYDRSNSGGDAVAAVGTECATRSTA